MRRRRGTALAQAHAIEAAKCSALEAELDLLRSNVRRAPRPLHAVGFCCVGPSRLRHRVALYGVRLHRSVVSSVAQTVGAQLHAQTEAQRKREAEERLKLESANADLRKVHSVVRWTESCVLPFSERPGAPFRLASFFLFAPRPRGACCASSLLCIALAYSAVHWMAERQPSRRPLTLIVRIECAGNGRYRCDAGAWRPRCRAHRACGCHATVLERTVLNASP